MCTGNICRSPFAERLLAAYVGPGIEVRSAGTQAVTGHGIWAPLITELRALGAHGDGHRARALDEVTMQGADLVLTATLEHRELALASCATALRRTFTMVEFARLAAALPEPVAGQPRALVAAAAALRGQVPVSESWNDDIADPYGQSAAFVRNCAGQIARTVAVAADVLAR